jgi:hypothetical protein
MTSATRRWRNLSTGQRRAIVVAASVQLALAAAAGVDLLRRPVEEVRGPKWAWAPAMAVNFVGPIAYLAWGRRSTPRG